jgi:AraC family transcriptional regulator of adaptative response / DNA-3-methyladenine glycosylase II
VHFARRLLDDTDLSVTEIAFAAGFGSLRQFNRACREVFRDSPRGLRARRRKADRLAADGGLPPEVLTIRGNAAVTVVDGIPEEYALSAERYLGADAAREYLAQIDQPGTRMARIDVRPAWVGLLDFQTRLPSALGGIT